MSVLPDPGASRAVLVGTSRYQHLEQLPAVSNNLQALAGILSSTLSLQLPTQHVAVVENPAAAHTVVSEVRQAAAEATDTLVIYFAGHGLIDPQDTLSLALPHTEFGRIETGLPYDWLRQALLLDSRAERHIVILDCCYSGLALGRMSASPGLADQAAVEGSYLLAAAAETRTALAPVGDTYTAFTSALLDTLRHGIPGGPALLDLETIYQHLHLTLQARGHPVPQARGRNSGARVALGRNHADLPASPATATPDAEATRRPWPDPSSIRTVTGFSTGLADVRVISGLTQQAVSRRSAGRISAATVSSLLNRTTLPTTWGTTASYLSACGVPDDQITHWQTAWQQLREKGPSADGASPTEPGTGETSTTSGGPSRRTVLLGGGATLATAAGALVALRLTNDSSDASRSPDTGSPDTGSPGTGGSADADDYSLAAHTGDVNSVAFSRDGIVASGSVDTTVWLWNIADRGQKPRRLEEGHRDKVNAVAFSRDGKTLVSGGINEMYFWEADGAKLGPAEDDVTWVMSVAFNHDGKILASGDYDHTVKLWDVARRKQIGTLKGHTDAVTSVAFDHDGKILASASNDNTILLWDLADLASASNDNTIRLWDLADRKRQLVKLTVGPKAGEEDDGLNGVAFSPDNKYLAAASGNHDVLLWEVADLKKDPTPDPTPLRRHSSPVLSVAFSGDSKTLASCGRDNTIRLWNVKDRELIVTLPSTDWVKSVAFSPDDKTLASGGDDDKVRVWKLPRPANGDTR
ncbi:MULTISPECIES: caspase, EACC1-associated type [unclassified Streptomyces]|uniref:caspase, EACC1-associated type n=1 Tax=unclassified Streptomyces TaxID=2593676 RepID=UPI002F906794